MEQNQGKILQVLGPVVDVQFDGVRLPAIHDALTVENGGEHQVLEVLKQETNEVKVTEKVRIQAGAPLEKMLMLAK